MLSDSFIDIHNQILRALVAIPGTPFSLHYSSDRVRGRAAAYVLNIPLSNKILPRGLEKIRLEIDVAGQRLRYDFPPSPEQAYAFTWDGRDGSGHLVNGKSAVKIRIGYVYKARYPRPEITRWKESIVAIGTWAAGALGFAGWSLSVHHAYDPIGGVLYFGDGTRRNNLDSDANGRSNGKATGQQGGREIILPAADGRELYIFDSSPRHLRTIHPLTAGVLYQFRYDVTGLLSEIEDGDGNITRIECKTRSVPSEIIGPSGQHTTLVSSGASYLAKVINAAGESIQFSYSNDGLLESLTDANDNDYRFTYDELGRLIRQEDPTGAITGLASKRDNNSSLIALITPLGREFTYLTERLATGEERRVNKCCGGSEIVDLGGQNTRTITYPDGMILKVAEQGESRFGMQGPLPKSQTILSSAGRTFSISNERTVDFADSQIVKTITDTLKINGHTYTAIYDAGTNTFTHTTPSGRQIKTTIDPLGRIVRLHRAGLLPINLAYNEQGPSVRATQGNGPDERTVRLSYNREGYLEKITDPLSRTMEFSYDASGRLIRETLSDGRTIQFAYDSDDNIISITPPGRRPHTFAYTATNLPSVYNPPRVADDSNQTHHLYNRDGELELITRPDGKTIKLTYDTAGRLVMLDFSKGQIVDEYDKKTGGLVSITAPEGIKVSYEYDGSLLMNTTWAGIVSGCVSRAYDNDFLVISLSVNDRRISFQYDSDGLLTEAGDLALTREMHNGVITGTAVSKIADTRGYNDYGDLTSYNAAFNGTGIYSVQYAHDKWGRIIEKNETIGGVTDTFVYGYDPAGRLAEVTKNGSTIATYTYDSNGNRISGPGLSAPPTYDVQDRLLQYGSTIYAYEANGELQSKTVEAGECTYAYDELGNLRGVTLFDGTQIEYVIDGANRRIGKKVDGILVQGWLYQDGLKPIAELDGSNKVISLFVYASRYNVPDYMVKNGTVYRLISDHLGSPRLVVQVDSGAVAQRMDYDDFGNVLTDTSPGFQPFGFAGGIYDQDTRLTRFGARDYDAETGRWTMKDPILFAGGDTNLFQYVFNDPINSSDVNGLQQQDNALVPDFMKNYNPDNPNLGTFEDSGAGLWGAEKVFANYGWSNLLGTAIAAVIGAAALGHKLGRTLAKINPWRPEIGIRLPDNYGPLLCPEPTHYVLGPFPGAVRVEPMGLGLGRRASP